MGSLILSVLMQFGISTAALYSITDFVAVATTPTGVPLLEIVSSLSTSKEVLSFLTIVQFRQATSSTTIAVVLQSLILVTGVVNYLLILTGASRLTYVPSEFRNVQKLTTL